MSNYKKIESDKMAESFKALSNPNRLLIFQRLLTCCEPGSLCSTDSLNGLCVGELGEHLDVAPSTLSHHIKELQRAGLIKTQRKGKNIECCVDTENIQKLINFFAISLSTDKQDKSLVE